MIPESALLKTVSTSNTYSKKICGLYPLERNILILGKSGIKKIYLNLSHEEHFFYKRRIEKRVKRLTETEIIDDIDGKPIASYISLPSNIFMQLHYFQDFTTYFTEKGNIFEPVIREDQFLLIDNDNFNKGKNIAKSTIINNIDGFIAKRINKSISIPISLMLSRTGVHPNILTLINMIIGILSALFLLQNSYWYIVLGGFFFQLASILDGVDGEVAKFTFKVSKIGGWLDTISDNTTLILFLIATSYLFFINFKGVIAAAIIGVMFVGLIILLLAMITFLKRYSESGSLVAYDREFLQKLPKEDPLASFVLKMKYITKKEFFALLFFLVTFTGRIELIIPGIAFILFSGGILLQILNWKYLKEFEDAAGKNVIF